MRSTLGETYWSTYKPVTSGQYPDNIGRGTHTCTRVVWGHFYTDVGGIISSKTNKRYRDQQL